MSRILCDDPAVKEALTDLQDLVIESGGSFSPEMRTVERAGDLTIRAEAPQQAGARLMEIPTVSARSGIFPAGAS